jgi:hypothetical protein
MPTPPDEPALICASVRPSRRTSRTAFSAEPPDPNDPLLGFAPYLHDRPRRNSITPDRQRAFIAALAATGIVTQAAREIGASLEALYKLRNRLGAEGFAAAWELAIDRGIARLEDCALERALLGEERPVVRGGEVVTTWRRYDTQLILFLLRQRRAQRFGRDAGGRFASAETEDTQTEQEVLDSIDAMIDQMRERSRINGTLDDDLG